MRIIATGLSIAEALRIQAATVAVGGPLAHRCYPQLSAGSKGTYDLVLPCTGCSILCAGAKALERAATPWCSGYIAAMTEDRNAALAEARAK
jgi:hypothetical protein